MCHHFEIIRSPLFLRQLPGDKKMGSMRKSCKKVRGKCKALGTGLAQDSIQGTNRRKTSIPWESAQGRGLCATQPNSGVVRRPLGVEPPLQDTRCVWFLKREFDHCPSTLFGFSRSVAFISVSVSFYFPVLRFVQITLRTRSAPSYVTHCDTMWYDANHSIAPPLHTPPSHPSSLLPPLTPRPEFIRLAPGGGRTLGTVTVAGPADGLRMKWGRGRSAGGGGSRGPQ